MSRTLLAVSLLLAPALTACPPSNEHIDPPLRPLVYTESENPGEAPQIPGYEMWTDGSDPTAYPGLPSNHLPSVLPEMEPEIAADADPERLARAVFAALCDTSADLDDMLLTPSEYSAAAYTSADAARLHMLEVAAETREVAAAFRGELRSEQRAGGLGTLLTIESVRVPSGRLASGEQAEEPELAVMVWGTEVVMRLGETDQTFRLRLPKVLRTADGRWGLAEAPELGGRFEMYLAMGFHLSSQMLAFEHYPLPLHTGNYWTYQIRALPRLAGDGHAEPEHTLDHDLPRFRDEVVARDDFDGYALVRVRRNWLESDQRSSDRWYVLTARRVFRCNRDCRRNIERIDWLLSHLSTSVTPEYVFPLSPGMGWRSGGRSDLEGDYQSWSDFELAVVPAGQFERAIRVTHSARAGRVNSFFVSGLGPVLERIDGATDTTYHELVDYRIIP